LVVALEARVMFGAGYRICVGRDGVALVLLLVGGSKASQTRDIRLAQVYWREYLGGK
jgi:putative addiction module killer protein